MSFYDDASLVFLPSGQAGKDGKAYSMKPVEELGSELVTNGDFANGSSNWSTYTSGSSNVVFSDDVATINIDGSNSNVGIYQENVFSSGVQYRIVLRAKGTSSFDAEVVESQAAATQQVISSFSLTTSYQDFVFTHTANGTNDIFIHRLFSASGANESIIIDSVSIKEITTPLADFTFSRGSNLTATRVDSNGLIEKGRENLLLQSNQFDTTWTLNDASVTSGQSGYDGSSDAWLLTKTGSYGQLQQSLSAFSGVHTFSVYIKAGDSNWARVRVGSAPKNSSFFDLQNGVIGASGTTPIDSNIENIGGGWYRCSITTNISASIVYVYPAEGDGLVSGTSGSIYIQDAQLEQGLVATEYIESGASTGLAGILEDSPRFDYSGGASCPSLLLEPSRTSLYQYSEYISNFQGTNTFNAANSPEGVSNAILLTKTSASDQFVNISWSGSSLSTETEYTMSLFVKYNGYDVDVRYEYNNFNDWGKGWNALFQVRSSGVTASTTASCTSDVKDYGNGWYRIIVNVETAASITPTASSNLVRIIGASADEVLIYGAGMEQGSYPTSYIPNHSGGSVTREVENLNDLDISSMITSSSFTWFLDLNDFIGSDNNHKTIRIQNTSGVEIQFRVRSDGYRFYYNGIAGGSTYPISGSTTANKFCVSYDGNDYRLYVDGTLEVTTRSVGDSGWDKIINEVKAPLPLKQMLLFPSKLSDAECITLTS